MQWLKRLLGYADPLPTQQHCGMDYLTRARLEIPTVQRLTMDAEAMKQWRARSEKRRANIAQRKIERARHGL